MDNLERAIMNYKINRSMSRKDYEDLDEEQKDMTSPYESVDLSPVDEAIKKKNEEMRKSGVKRGYLGRA